MCFNEVILFDCGHTRKVKQTHCCNEAGIYCSEPTRVLTPQGAGTGIENPLKKLTWTCAFKCKPGFPAHDLLIDAARENADVVKAEIENRIEVLSVLNSPYLHAHGEGSDYGFDQRYTSSLSRRQSSSNLNGWPPMPPRSSSYASSNEDNSVGSPEEGVRGKLTIFKMDHINREPREKLAIKEEEEPTN